MSCCACSKLYLYCMPGTVGSFSNKPLSPNYRARCSVPTHHGARSRDPRDYPTPHPERPAAAHSAHRRHYILSLLITVHHSGVPLRAYLVCTVSEPRVSPAICGPFFILPLSIRNGQLDLATSFRASEFGRMVQTARAAYPYEAFTDFLSLSQVQTHFLSTCLTHD